MRIVCALILSALSVNACAQTSKFQWDRLTFESNPTYLKTGDNITLRDASSVALDFNYISLKWNHLSDMKQNGFASSNNRLIALNYKGSLTVPENLLKSIENS